jgi:hypothetical protein
MVRGGSEDGSQMDEAVERGSAALGDHADEKVRVTISPIV